MVSGSVAWISDICVPISHLNDAISRAKSAIDVAGLIAPILGHVGDGNFHVFFILHPDDTSSWEKARVINEAMIDHALSVGFKSVLSRNGGLSATSVSEPGMGNVPVPL